MNALPPFDDDGLPMGKDNRVQIERVLRTSHYKVKAAGDLVNLNWKLNRIQTSAGDYTKNIQSRRSVEPAINALVELHQNVTALQKTMSKVNKYKAARTILFQDAIEKAGRHKILFTLDSVITSPELQAVLKGLTPHQLRLRLPKASGPIPITPLLPELVPLLHQLEICLEPISHTRRMRKIPSLAARSAMAGALLKIIRISFSDSAIRNAATNYKLPLTNV